MYVLRVILDFCSLLEGGELFAKRRKKADKWVVDEHQIGTGQHPSMFADEFIAQQSMAQQSVYEEKEMETRAQQAAQDELDAQQRAEQQEFQQQQQQIFQEQQMMKQQQSMQIKQQQMRYSNPSLENTFKQSKSSQKFWNYFEYPEGSIRFQDPWMHHKPDAT